MVIQRIQNLYLLVAAVLLAIFAFFPAVTISTNGNDLYVIGILKSGIAPDTRPDFILLAMDLLIVVLTALTICSFKDLKRQLRLCSITIALIVALLLCVGVLVTTMGELGTARMTWWNVLPLLSLICTYLAHHGINHDRKVLSDSQRLR